MPNDLCGGSNDIWQERGPTRLGSALLAIAVGAVGANDDRRRRRRAGRVRGALGTPRIHSDRYSPLARRALAGDEAARAAPGQSRRGTGSPSRWLLIEPLIDDRDPARIARTRAIVGRCRSFRSPTVTCAAGCGGGARSRCARWAAPAARPHGGAHRRARRSASGRAAAALDALTDMHDLASLQAVVVRLHDTSLHRGPPARRSRRSGRSARTSCSSCRRSTPRTASTTSMRWPSAARPGRARRLCAGRATRVSRSARRHLKRWRTWASTPRRPAWPSRGWRATTQPVRAMAAYALRGWRARRRGRPPRAAPRRHVGGRRPGRADASVDGQRRLARAAGAGLALRPRRPARAPDAVADGRTMLTETAAPRCSSSACGHRVLRAVERVADRDEPDRPAVPGAHRRAAPATRPRAGRARRGRRRSSRSSCPPTTRS